MCIAILRKVVRDERDELLDKVILEQRPKAGKEASCVSCLEEHFRKGERLSEKA